MFVISGVPMPVAISYAGLKRNRPLIGLCPIEIRTPQLFERFQVVYELRLALLRLLLKLLSSTSSLKASPPSASQSAHSFGCTADPCLDRELKVIAHARRLAACPIRYFPFIVFVIEYTPPCALRSL